MESRRRYKRMKLRDHPWLIQQGGMKVWPPLWIDIRGVVYKNPRGESGYLRHIDHHPGMANALLLWIEFEGHTYVGVMHFDDSLFCSGIRKILERQIGFTLQKIGDLDL